jgi:hypothetical protein
LYVLSLLLQFDFLLSLNRLFFHSSLYLKSNKITKEILEQLEKKFNNLKSLDNTFKFVWLLSAENIYVFGKFYLLLTKLYTFRCEALSGNI